MLEIAVLSFTTFFATVSPIDVAILFGALTARASPERKRSMAIKGTLIATLLLTVFAVFGRDVLGWMGISLPALRTAGGILLMLVAIDLVFARPSGISSTTVAETNEAEGRDDISVFPLATPLIAGAGSIGAAILMFARADGDLGREIAVIGALLAVMAITLVLLLVASRLQRFVGGTGQNVISRVIGILLAALAVQFVFDGLREAGIAG